MSNRIYYLYVRIKNIPLSKMSNRYNVTKKKKTNILCNVIFNNKFTVAIIFFNLIIFSYFLKIYRKHKLYNFTLNIYMRIYKAITSTTSQI